MELGTGCSYAAKKDCAQLECGNAFSRTGLGLEIARSLLERMHGSISAEYAQNRLCICIRLPNTARKHIPCESLATGESTCRGFQKTVL